MPFDMYKGVILTRDVSEHGPRARDLGTVVERHVVSGVAEEGYSVEFFDMTGNTVAVATLPARSLRVSTPADRRQPCEPSVPKPGNVTTRRSQQEPIGTREAPSSGHQRLGSSMPKQAEMAPITNANIAVYSAASRYSSAEGCRIVAVDDHA
jgi:Domain of unknown function (DUF4926)